jgi:hypothetical protein
VIAILKHMTDEMISSLKQLLRDPLGDIRLEDLLSAHSTAIVQQLSEERFKSRVEDLSAKGFAPVWIQQVRDYDEVLAPLIEPARLIGAYGLATHAAAWKAFMKPLSRWAGWTEGIPALVQLRGYPALLLLYVVAIAAVLRDNYGPLHGVASLPRVRIRPGVGSSSSDPLIAAVDVSSIVADGINPIASALAMSDEGTEVTDELVERLMRGGGRHTPMSDHLHAVLRSVFISEVDHDGEWDSVFDRAEVLLDALTTDADAQEGRHRFGYSGGFGRYTWRYKHDELPIEKRVLSELERDGDRWLPISAGLFGGQTDRASAALSAVVEAAGTIRNGRW